MFIGKRSQRKLDKAIKDLKKKGITFYRVILEPKEDNTYSIYLEYQGCNTITIRE